jgi:hypothetical protein
VDEFTQFAIPRTVSVSFLLKRKEEEEKLATPNASQLASGRGVTMEEGPLSSDSDFFRRLRQMVK